MQSFEIEDEKITKKIEVEGSYKKPLKKRDAPLSA